MSNSIAKLAPEHFALLNELMETGRELTVEDEEKILAFTTKVDNTSRFLNTVDLYESHLESMIEAMQKNLKTLKKTNEFIREHYKQRLLAEDVQVFKGEHYSISLQRNAPSVEVNDLSLLDKSYLRIKTVTEPDKSKIKEDLKLGVPVTGARLIEGYSVKVKLNKGV